MIDLVVILILVLIVGAIWMYIYKSRRSGVKCIGCPFAKQCGGKCSCKPKNDEPPKTFDGEK